MGSKGIGLSGLTVKSIKKNPAIIPIYALLAAGCGLAGYYVFRLATKSPEVSWNKRGNPEPWNEYRNKQHKFVNIAGRDYAAGSPAPKYQDE